MSEQPFKYKCRIVAIPDPLYGLFTAAGVINWPKFCWQIYWHKELIDTSLDFGEAVRLMVKWQLVKMAITNLIPVVEVR